jgi:hypothetical protein
MNDADFAGAKMPLIVADYRTYFDAATRLHDGIAKIRQWEITIVSGVSIFLGRYGIDNYSLIAPLLLLVLVFWALDARNAWLLFQNHQLDLAVEQRLLVSDQNDFLKNIINWEFGNSFGARNSKSMPVLELLKRMKSKSLVLLHGLLAVLSIFFFIATAFSLKA